MGVAARSVSTPSAVRPEAVTGPAQPPTEVAPVDPRFADFARSRDRALRNALVEDHRWLAQHCVRRFRRKGEPVDDLEQVAMVGLIKAVDRFVPDLGYTFSTYAVPTITGELRRHFRDRTWSMRVNRRVKENYLTVKTVVDELQGTLGRSPLIPEIADRAGLTEEDALEALEVGGCYRPASLDVTGADDETSGIACRVGVPEPGYAASEARAILPELLAELPTDRDRQIVKLRFVDEMSQSRIAAELGLSQVHVSRLLRTSLQTMRRRLTRLPR